MSIFSVCQGVSIFPSSFLLFSNWTVHFLHNSKESEILSKNVLGHIDFKRLKEHFKG